MWWLWNDSLFQKQNDDSHPTPTADSDLFCTTTIDGITWEQPCRLPASSAAIDQMPMLSPCASVADDAPDCLTTHATSLGPLLQWPRDRVSAPRSISRSDVR